MRSRAGFSLIELLVTITIVGLILGFSLPALNRYHTRWQLEQAKRTLTSEIKLLRQKAIAESRDRRAWFSPSSRYYWFQDPETFVWTSYLLPPRVTMEYVYFTGGYYDTYMRPDGRSLRSGTIILRNTNMERDTLVVDLSGWVGEP
jgi:prepilin-type N-terminal cleavage/methylation domain-containing protein